MILSRSIASAAIKRMRMRSSAPHRSRFRSSLPRKIRTRTAFAKVSLPLLRSYPKSSGLSFTSSFGKIKPSPRSPILSASRQTPPRAGTATL